MDVATVGWFFVALLVVVGLLAEAEREARAGRRHLADEREAWRRYRLEMWRARSRAIEDGIAPPTRLPVRLRVVR